MLAGKSCSFIFQFQQVWVRIHSISCAFVDTIPSAQLPFFPSNISFLNYLTQGFKEMTYPSRVSKIPSFLLPQSYVLNCFMTDCSCLILFAGTISESCSYVSKCSVFLVGVNTPMYKWLDVHLQINLLSKCISMA